VGQPAFIEIRELSKSFQEGDRTHVVLDRASMTIARGELVVLLGRSGSGKTTLLNLLSGIDLPDAGEIAVDGIELHELAERDRTLFRRRRIGFVFQFFNLLPMLDARENILLPLSVAGEKPEAGWFDGLIAEVGLGDRLDHRPAELSGGQQQRVAIARALVSRPTVLFADEPTGNLDSTTGHEILELMRRSVDTLGQTTVMVTHDARAAAMADRVLFLADGLIVNELAGASAHEILVAMEALDGR